MRLRSLALVPSFLCVTAPSYAAPITYYYTGKPFDTVTGNYTTSDFITGTFTVDGPLRPNKTIDDFYGVFPLSFSFSDGHQTVDQDNAVFSSFAPFTTDAAGNVTNYQVFVFSALGGIGFADFYVNGPYDAANTDSGFGSSAQIGTLTVGAPASVTPEPSSFALLGTGLFGVAAIVRKRFA